MSPRDLLVQLERDLAAIAEQIQTVWYAMPRDTDARATVAAMLDRVTTEQAWLRETVTG